MSGSGLWLGLLALHCAKLAAEPAVLDCSSTLTAGAEEEEEEDQNSLLQHSRKGIQVSLGKRVTTPLVDAVYTYGAPATCATPFRNAAREDGCFPGLRTYTEDVTGAGWVGPATHVDAAAISNFFPHAWVNTLVLREKGDSIFVPCDRHTLFGHPDWPKRTIDSRSDWFLHKESTYRPRLGNLTLGGKTVTKEEPFASAKFFADLAWRSYESYADQKKALEHMPGWRLIVAVVDSHGDDTDPVQLLQHEQTLECALVFTGTNSASEFGTSMAAYGTGYCGFEGVHAGYRNELWTITKYLWPALRPKLETCGKVSCVGHSLGGALCEVFAACANSGNVSSDSFKQLAWKKGVPRLRREWVPPAAALDQKTPR